MGFPGVGLAGACVVVLFRLLLFVLAFLLLRRLWRARGRRAVPAPRQVPQPATDLQACPVCGLYLTPQSSGCDKADCPRRPAGKATLGVCLGVLALVLAGPVRAAEAEAGGGRYLVQVAGAGADVTLFVNHIPAERWLLADNSHAGASVNHWLREGDNTLEIVASFRGEASRVQVRAWFLGIGTRGGVQTVDLLREDMTRDATGQGRASVTFNVPSAPALGIWRAGQAALPDREQLRSLLKPFHDQIAEALAAGRSPLDSPALALEQQDAVRAYGGDATQPPLAVSGSPGQNGVRVLALPEANDLRVAPVVGTALLRVARSDGRPLLVAEAGGTQFAVPAVLVGYLSGAWRILRRCH